MDIDKKLLLKNKLAIQYTKNELATIDGIHVLEIFEIKQNPQLEKRYLDYIDDWHNQKIIPAQKCTIYSAKEELCSWVIQAVGIESGKKYFIFYSSSSITIVAKIKIIAPNKTVSSMLYRGIFLIDCESNKIYDIGCYSDDEYNYSMYIQA